MRSARSIVPSPPSTTARSAVAGSPCSARPCRAASSAETTSSTPASSCHGREALDARADLLGPAVRDERDPLHGADPQPTAASIQRWTSSGSEGSSLAIRWTTNSRFPFGPGWPESTTPADACAPARRCVAELAQHAPVHRRVAHDALRRVGPTRLELRLDEHERLPAGRRERERGRQTRVAGDERDVARDELGRERQRVEVARVRRARARRRGSSAQPRVELAVADVERDHPRRAALQQAVGEAAGRGAEVETVASRRIDAERVERVRELLARRARRSAAAARPRAATSSATCCPGLS